MPATVDGLKDAEAVAVAKIFSSDDKRIKQIRETLKTGQHEIDCEVRLAGILTIAPDGVAPGKTLYGLALQLLYLVCADHDVGLDKYIEDLAKLHRTERLPEAVIEDWADQQQAMIDEEFPASGVKRGNALFTGALTKVSPQRAQRAQRKKALA